MKLLTKEKVDKANTADCVQVATKWLTERIARDQVILFTVPCSVCDVEESSHTPQEKADGVFLSLAESLVVRYKEGTGLLGLDGKSSLNVGLSGFLTVS